MKKFTNGEEIIEVDETNIRKINKLLQIGWVEIEG
jgi:hypothetical protein